MANDRFVIAMIAGTMYEEELAKRLGINPHSEYGRKRLNEYLEEERKSDELSAKIHLQNSNPGKFISYAEIRSEANRIKQKRLEPYVEKAKRKQKEKISNSEFIQSEFSKEEIMEQLQKTRDELAIQHDDLCDQYDELAKKLKIRSTAETRTERIQDKVSIKIELKKLENRIKVLSRVIDAFDTNISLSKYNITTLSTDSTSTSESINQEFLSLLESEYKKLDVLSTKMVLSNEFATERLKGTRKYDLGLTPALGGVISIWCIGIPFQYIANLPFSLVNLLLPIAISGIGGAIGTSYVIKKLTHKKIDAFINLNNQLGDESLSIENDDTLEEKLGLETLIDKKIHDIMIILMKQKEYQSLAVSTESSKKQFDWTQHLGRNSVENVINDTTPFPDKVLRPVGFEIPETQSDISWVEPYLAEDIETDEVINSQEQAGPVLVKRRTPPKHK